MKKIAALLLCLMLAGMIGAAPAENGSELAGIFERGKLIIGVTEFRPMDYRNEEGEWVGFDADLARAFAEYLGVEAEFREIDWNDRFRELEEKSIDCVWNAMTLSPAAQEGMSCSRPYMYNAQMVVVPADKAGDYSDPKSLSGLVFAVHGGTVSETIVGEMGWQVKTMQSAVKALAEVQNGGADAAVIDYQMATALIGKGKTFDDLTALLPLNEEKYGVGCRKDSDLTDAINLFLASALADGTMEEIALTYGVFGTLYRD